MRCIGNAARTGCQHPPPPPSPPHAHTLLQVLVQCSKLSSLTITDNPLLDTAMLWSDDLTSLDLTGCNNIITLKLHCPNLVSGCTCVRQVGMWGDSMLAYSRRPVLLPVKGTVKGWGVAASCACQTVARPSL